MFDESDAEDFYNQRCKMLQKENAKLREALQIIVSQDEWTDKTFECVKLAQEALK